MTAALGPTQKRLLYVVTTLLWISGAVWYCLPQTNPSQPLWLKLHGATAMGFLMMLGALILKHIPNGWRQKYQRPSGVTLLSVCGILVITGWGLYYVGDDQLRHWISFIHTWIGLFLPIILGVHIWLAWRRSTKLTRTNN